MNPVEREKMHYHSLALRANESYAGLCRLKAKYGSWTAAWAGAPVGDPAAQWDSLAKASIHLLLPEEAAFPAALTHIPHPPLGLYLRGTWSTEAPIVAIVGTRKAGPTGCALAEEFAAALGGAGLAVASGLAFGIDAAAHRGALAAQAATVAVMAGGLDQIYPRSNAALAEAILRAGGALLSEYPPGAEPLPYRFLERNRLVSGLARGVLVIEAPVRSGSLATARFALEQNRDVFVVPGPARHPNYRGSHELIRAGAELVTEPAQILAAWNLDPVPDRVLSPAEKQVLDILGASGAPLPIDKIAELTNLEIRLAMQAVNSLSLDGEIHESPRGYALSPTPHAQK